MGSCHNMGRCQQIKKCGSSQLAVVTTGVVVNTLPWALIMGQSSQPMCGFKQSSQDVGYDATGQKTTLHLANHRTSSRHQ